MNTNFENTISLAQLAEELNVCGRTIRNRMKQGNYSNVARKSGGYWRFAFPAVLSTALAA